MVYSQKINHSGQYFWEDDCRSIVSEVNKQSQVRLTVDGSGGVYYVWEDERNDVYPETEIYLQHIDSNNSISFEQNGFAVCDAPYYQFSPVVRSYNGDALVVWGDRRTGSIGLHLQNINPANANSRSFNFFDLIILLENRRVPSLYIGLPK